MWIFSDGCVEYFAEGVLTSTTYPAVYIPNTGDCWTYTAPPGNVVCMLRCPHAHSLPKITLADI